MTPESIPYILLLGALYGTTLIASRFGVGQMHPTVYISLRLALASLGYGFIYAFKIQGRRLPRERAIWRHGAVVGVMGIAMGMTLIVASLQYLSSGVGGAMLTLGPVMTVVLAHFLLDGERLTGRKVFGVLLALSGALLLALLGESGIPDVGRANPLGYVLSASALLLGSSSLIYTRKYMQQVGSFDAAATRMFMATLVLIPYTFFTQGFDVSGVTTAGWLATAWAALAGTFTAGLVEFYNVKRFGATATSMTTYVVPIIGALGGVWLLGEEITPGILMGMGIILSGLWVLNAKKAPAPVA